jgi:hypothetical protein
MVLEPIESAVQLSSIFPSSLKTDPPSTTSSTDVDLQHCSKQLIRCLSATLQQQNDYLNGSSPSYRSNVSTSDTNGCCRQPSHNHKRAPRIIGKRGTRDTEFMHPSSLAYSKRDQIICKKQIFLFEFIYFFELFLL